MLTSVSERLIQFQRIVVLTDLSSEAEKAAHYASSLARWYGSDLMIAQAEAPESLTASAVEAPSNSFGTQRLSKAAAEKMRVLNSKLNLRDLTTKAVFRQGNIGSLLKELEDYRPGLLVLATHGRQGIGKWLSGSVAEEVFRRVQWPVLVLGPGFKKDEEQPQKQFERVLYATDLSAVSLKALQYAAGIAHDHEAQLLALYVEPDSTQGYTFDHVMAQQRLEDWLRDQIDGLSEALKGVQCIVHFGQPERKILETATEHRVDLLVVGARGLGAASRPASHFLGGTAYEVICSSSCPVLIVPQLR